MYLRCHWAYKTIIYKLYAEKINIKSNFIQYKNAKADVMFIFENLDGKITHSFFAVQ